MFKLPFLCLELKAEEIKFSLGNVIKINSVELERLNYYSS